MKRPVFLFILFILHLSVSAQSDYYFQEEIKKVSKDPALQYKPFEEFKSDTMKHREYRSDTIAYLEHNFIKRLTEAYAGMTVGEFIDMLPFPIVKTDGTNCNVGGGCRALKLYIVNDYPKHPLDSNPARLYIVIGVDSEVKRRHMDATVGSRYESDVFIDTVTDHTITYAIVYKNHLEDYKILMGMRKLRAEKKKKLAEENM